jgi:predicted HTH transcriptional regulator
VRTITLRDLETLRLVTDHQGRKVPTVGGMLLFGRERERHFPDAWIQAGRFRGADKSGIVDRAEIHSFPVSAIEAVINAVAHTDYAQRGAPIRVSIFEDRLEVENPGLLPFGLTIEDLHHGISKLRNRVIGRVFHTLDLIEQWGSGVQRMTAACIEM